MFDTSGCGLRGSGCGLRVTRFEDEDEYEDDFSKTDILKSKHGIRHPVSGILHLVSVS